MDDIVNPMGVKVSSQINFDNDVNFCETLLYKILFLMLISE